ncbi:DNA primase [Sediminicola sp. 1XM1-17]|uniref:DNA primase n=1 Tax=Sediminicola sp. 1XM1-17 TaxID=3127702 RepID=UPI003077A640
MISKSTIDQVYETARLEEVIGDFVQLKKSGSNFKGLSPFTDERSPSFMVSPVKQIWKDFSSGKGGNVVAFLMEHEHFTYPEAIKYLAKKYNIEIEETEQSSEQKEEANERESMYLVSEYAQQYFTETLRETELGKAIGLSYFKERGFTDETIEKWGLGYCLDQWDAFTNTALDKGYQLKYLEKTGLTIIKENPGGGETKKFDRFKGRVMFPIHSMSGRVLGFGGRILTNDKKAAKYLNSPESDIYHKSKVLYGIFHAKQAIAKEDNCYLVEGYTDVIQFYQRGIHNVVASSGTALTPDQIRLINRLTKNITVLFDGDAAGLRASLRGIDLILEQGMNVKICTFPEGEDPDSFSKNNTYEDVIAYLQDNSKDFIQFKASLLVEEAANDPIKRADTVRDIVHSISKIPDRIQREIYVQECASIMNISEAVLFNTLAQIGKKDMAEAAKKAPQEQRAFEVVKNDKKAVEKVDVQYELERKLIELLLLYGNQKQEFEDLILKENESGDLVLEPEVLEAKVYEKIYLDLQEDEIELTHEQFKNIYYKLIEGLNEKEDFAINSFLSELDQELVSEISSILMEEDKYVLHDWERKDIYPKEKKVGVAQLVSETILTLRCFLIKRRIDVLQQNTQNMEEDHRETLEEIMNYLQLNKLLNKKLNRVLS